MIKRATRNIIIIFLLFGSSCEKIMTDPDPENTPMKNFQVLWENLDRNYPFFTYKNIDWDSIYQIFQPTVHEEIPDSILFKILGEMLLQLKDAHTDIWSPYGSIQYDFTAGHPSNFSKSILEIGYLGKNYGYRDGIQYKVLDSIGYLYIESFSTEISDKGFREIINELSDVRGYIIDVRNNIGGNSENSLVVANHFFNSKKLVEINYFKTGPGHDDLSPVNHYIIPKKSLKIDKQTVILTNRSCFSATNFFVSWMSTLPQVILIGDTTGGGGGTPHFSELPNGFGYRYSSNQSYRPDGLNLDIGIPPDHLVYQTESDTRKVEDTLLKFALSFFNESRK